MEIAPAGPLKQGDVCKLDVFPVWQLDTAGAMPEGPYAGVTLIPTFPRTLPYQDGVLAIVCSHDCDLENPRGRSALQLAPLTKVPASPHEDRYEIIMASDRTTPDDEWNFIQVFPLKLPQELGAQDVVADFSAITSLGKATEAADLLTSVRVAGLNEDERTQIRLKLGAFLGRGYQEPRPAA